jgi:hypothetical protein
METQWTAIVYTALIIIQQDAINNRTRESILMKCKINDIQYRKFQPGSRHAR